MKVSARQWLRTLELVKATTGTDFSAYTAATPRRRLLNHAAMAGCRTMSAYLRLIEGDPAAVGRLHNALLIKVTSFFRDQSSWKPLASQVKRLAADRAPLCAWSAGCATGEEAYSLALLFARARGTGPGARWKVFATDLDDDALATARAARYSDEQVRAIPKPDLERYFEREGLTWRVGKALRSCVVFSRHDILRNPPLNKMDLVSCRNVLVYFRTPGRRRALNSLSFAVKAGGVLFLGQADARGPPDGFDHLAGAMFIQRNALPSTVPGKKAKSALEATALGAAAFGGMLEESTSVLAVAIGRSGHVVSWNRAAEDFFGMLAGQAIGKSLPNAVGAKVARQLRAAMKAGTGEGTQVVVEDEGPRGPRRLHVECLSASPPTAVLFLATTSHGAGPTPKPSQEVRHMVRVGGLYPASGALLRSPQDLTQELHWRSDEMEILNDELLSINDEFSASEAATRAALGRWSGSDTMLRQVIDTASRPFILCDSENVVVIWNTAAVRMYGLSSLQAVGKELFGLVPALNRVALRTASSRARKPGPSRASHFVQDGTEYSIDPMAARAGKRRHYLLRVGALQA